MENDYKKVECCDSSEIPKDLQEAADKYSDENEYMKIDFSDKTIYIGHKTEKAFIAGAKWQKEQDNVISRQAEAERIKTQQMCYEKGQADMKEQMMKGAVEGEIFDYYDKDICEHHLTILSTVPSRYKDGDKVRIIIVKEEGKHV